MQRKNVGFSEEGLLGVDVLRSERPRRGVGDSVVGLGETRKRGGTRREREREREVEVRSVKGEDEGGKKLFVFDFFVFSTSTFSHFTLSLLHSLGKSSAAHISAFKRKKLTSTLHPSPL